jgi:hypothetical protein
MSLRLTALASFAVFSVFSAGCAAGDAPDSREPPTLTDDVHARTVIVRAGGDRTSEGQARADVSLGFRDSSFDGDEKSFCFVGRARDVCGLVGDAAAKMQGEYSSGAHDTIHVQSCAVSDSGADAKVDLRYRLTDDYGGDLSVAKTIEKCSVGLGANIYASTVATTASTIHVTASVGFYDSSFDVPTKTFCYTGQARTVCTAIEQHAKAMHEQYAEGAHDDMGLESCSVATVGEEDWDKREVVTAKYQLTDDWGGNLDVTRTIEPCYDSTR